jgi:hypothetical protein
MEIKVTKEAEEIGLATMLADLIRQNVEGNFSKKIIFYLTKGKVFIKAVDADVEITLEFNRGSLTVHKGKKGRPHIEIEADSETIVNLSQIKTIFFMPVFLDSVGINSAKKILTGNLKIRKLVFHPLLLIKLTNLVSVNSIP